MRKRALLRLARAFITSLISISLVYAQNQNKSSQQAAEDDVIRVNTTFVTLPVSVMDSHGRLIQDLKREDFHLYEDGVAQEIAYFEPPGDARPDSPHKPFTIALLLDVSDSTEFKLEQIRTVALAFLNLLHPEDRVIIVAFDKRVQILAEATNDRDTLSAAIKRARTGGGTSLYLAIDTVINRRLSRVAGRKAVVLLTDGVDTASIGATSDSTIRAAQSSDVVIYPIQYNTYG